MGLSFGLFWSAKFCLGTKFIFFLPLLSIKKPIVKNAVGDHESFDVKAKFGQAFECPSSTFGLKQRKEKFGSGGRCSYPFYPKFHKFQGVTTSRSTTGGTLGTSSSNWHRSYH